MIHFGLWEMLAFFFCFAAIANFSEGKSTSFSQLNCGISWPYVEQPFFLSKAGISTVRSEHGQFWGWIFSVCLLMGLFLCGFRVGRLVGLFLFFAQCSLNNWVSLVLKSVVKYNEMQCICYSNVSLVLFKIWVAVWLLLTCCTVC